MGGVGGVNHVRCAGTTSALEGEKKFRRTCLQLPIVKMLKNTVFFNISCSKRTALTVRVTLFLYVFVDAAKNPSGRKCKVYEVQETLKSLRLIVGN